MPDIEFTHGSASQLPIAEETLSWVVSCLTFHEVKDVADKTLSLGEAIRVLKPGGRFAFVDLFDDPSIFHGRERVLDSIRGAGGEVESAQVLSEILALNWPTNTRKVLGYAVLITGTKR